EGGFVQGLGYALFEEMIWDNGRLANPNLMDYTVPGSMDVPYDIHSIIVEHPEPDGPFGAKGVGEVSIVAVAGSIANAILNAVGVKMKKLPMSSERIFNALKAKGT
ncbi:MAG: molybdopterin cofactor-binding domain-containing protein, partial [Pseudomonadota bacterium]|nr:molybdopterin cofactor-binding domain-containing protein [Pseudomonadota bacterium]